MGTTPSNAAATSSGSTAGPGESSNSTQSQNSQTCRYSPGPAVLPELVAAALEGVVPAVLPELVAAVLEGVILGEALALKKRFKRMEIQATLNSHKPVDILWEVA